MKHIINSTILIFTLFTFSHTADYTNYGAFLKKYVCNKGVAYSKIMNEEIFGQIDKEFSLVTEKSFNGFSKNEQIAFLINLYNFNTIVLIKNHYPISGIRKISNPWDQKIVPLFGKKFSLNHIEHKILRKNYDEPRIHFALVCASIGCPEMSNEAFTGKNLENQLDKVARIFLTDTSKNRVDGKKLHISKIFQWYGKDFSNKFGGYKKYIIETLELSGKYSIKYLPYNWNLNETKGCK